MQIRTAGDLRGFLADIMVGIKDGTVECAQAHAISKVAAQINQSLATEVNTALALERMGKDRPIAGSMLIGNSDAPEMPALDDADRNWVSATIRQVERIRKSRDIDDFVAAHSDRLEILMESRPDLHSQITTAISEVRDRLNPKQAAQETDGDEDPAEFGFTGALAAIDEKLRDDLMWCEQCDMRVDPTEAASCKSRHCSLKAVA